MHSIWQVADEMHLRRDYGLIPHSDLQITLQVEYNWTGNELYGTLLAKYVYYSKYLQLALVIMVPIVAVAFLNVSLICLMRNRVVMQRNRSTSSCNSNYRLSFRG